MSLLSIIKRWFISDSAPAEKPVTTPVQQAPSSDSQAKNKKRKKTNKKKRKNLSENSNSHDHNIAAKAPKVCPEELREVEPLEGRVRFLDLNIDRKLQFGLQAIDFEYCTPIQERTLEPLLSGRDVCGKAQTGTGKTAAFLIAVFNKLLTNPVAGERRSGSCRAVVLAPTRELAIQIHKDAELIGQYTGLKNVVVFGGMDHEKQRRQLSGPVDLLIGTPGRVIDFSRSGALDFSRAEMLVIDEADRMLDMGFIPDVRRIVAQLPRREDRQTLLFSATLEESILRLASGFLNDPLLVESEPEQIIGETIEQVFYTVSVDEKLPVLLNTIKNEVECPRTLIFGNRKDKNLQLQDRMAAYGVKAALLSGDIPQQKRLDILEKFRSGDIRVVIATDVAARGIHVDDVGLVINYDLPEQPEDYVHRIGRTGRAGNAGRSISFVCEYGAYAIPALEDLLKTRIVSIMPEDELLVMPERDPNYRSNSKTNRRPPLRGGHHNGRSSAPSYRRRSTSQH